MAGLVERGAARSAPRTDRAPRRDASPTDGVDWTGLAADLDAATRVRTRLRPDGLVEVSVAGAVVGFVDHVPPLFVAYAGERSDRACEVAQCRSLELAVELLRSGE